MAACDPIDVNCPHRVLLDQITDRWSVMVLTALEDGPMRFNALKRHLAGITQKSLTQALRRLERNGLVARRVTDAPLSVEYRITPLGVSTLAPVLALYAWTVDRLAEVERARQLFDGRADGRLAPGNGYENGAGPD